MNKLTLKTLLLFLLLCGYALAEPAVQELTLSHDAVQPGQTVTGTVLLDAPAPAEGMQVELWSDHDASTPTYVFIPAGELRASFPIQVRHASTKSLKVAALQPTASAVASFQVSSSVLSSR